MKWLKDAKSKNDGGDISVNDAFDALSKQGFFFSDVSMTTSYTYDAWPEIDLIMKVKPDPKKFADVVDAVNKWFWAKGPGGGV